VPLAGVATGLSVLAAAWVAGNRPLQPAVAAA
jgi:hypothetical protein